jgi:hypothetical protein
MERSAWTDERLDGLAGSMDRNFGLVRADIADVRTEIRELRTDLSAWQRQIAQIGWGLVFALIGAIVALVVAVA